MDSIETGKLRLGSSCPYMANAPHFSLTNVSLVKWKEVIHCQVLTEAVQGNDYCMYEFFLSSGLSLSQYALNTRSLLEGYSVHPYRGKFWGRPGMLKIILVLSLYIIDTVIEINTLLLEKISFKIYFTSKTMDTEIISVIRFNQVSVYTRIYPYIPVYKLTSCILWLLHFYLINFNTSREIYLCIVQLVTEIILASSISCI